MAGVSRMTDDVRAWFKTPKTEVVVGDMEEADPSQHTGQRSDNTPSDGQRSLQNGDGIASEGRGTPVVSRIPSQGVKPRMIRTPASGFRVPEPPVYSSDDESQEPEEMGEGDGFLITELHQEDGRKSVSSSDPGEDSARTPTPDSDRETRSHSAPSRSPPQPRPDTAEYDTDLDIDDDDDGVDLTGRSTYMKMCEKLGIVPASYFSRHITQPEIHMKHHGLGPQGTRAIARVLRDNITLEKLNLDGNWMEGEGAMYMARTMAENDYISDLSLAENKLGTEGAHYMAQMLLNNSTLKRLNLSGNCIGNSAAASLTEAIEQNKFLGELNLSHNVLGELAGEVLGPAMGANDVLDHLDLSWNQLRRAGAVAVARGLKENVRLKTCNLAWNGFGPEGGAAVADALGSNQSLLEVDLSGNRLDLQSAFLLAKALKVNEELRTLKIANNPITTTGAVAIVTALSANDGSVLVFLDLTDIPVEYEFLKTVEQIKSKRNFQVIHGPVLRSGNTTEDIGKPPIDAFRKLDPLVILKEHIVVNDLRILDILQQYDKEGLESVSQEQFASALEELGVPFTKTQLEGITKKLDKNADGRIHYGDILRQFQQAQDQKEESNMAAPEVVENGSLPEEVPEAPVPPTTDTSSKSKRSKAGSASSKASKQSNKSNKSRKSKTKSAVSEDLNGLEEQKNIPVEA